ncbi:hypothetical protein C2R22_21630 (plasmid) [Salinigranum rubrum]|uniref:Uncharacterized protein n=1 Tax=Salinigranum rubrum TaxID=755307 RepID=A0A2I8VQH6_9EURY|nr:hypothetical protein C2R22_21630 [Salinigranum rubrum]
MCKTEGDENPTSDLRVIDAVNPRFERAKPLYDAVSAHVVQTTDLVYSNAGGRVVVAIDERVGVREVVSLGESLEKRCYWTDVSSFEAVDAGSRFEPSILQCTITTTRRRFYTRSRRQRPASVVPFAGIRHSRRQRQLERPRGRTVRAVSRCAS